MGCAFGAEQKKSRDAALFLCAGILIGVWKYACKASRAICIRIRSPRQSGTSQRQKGGMGCAFGAEQKRAAMRLFFFARAPLLAYENTPARLPVQSASESAALGKAGHPTGRAGACSHRMREGCVHLTPQTGGTQWGARSGRTAPRGSPRQSRMPAGRSADNSRSSATRCA